MATPTYIALATTTLGSTDSQIDFASIPSSFRDLVLVVNATTSANAVVALRLNSDSGGNYYFVQMRGYSSTAASGSASGVAQIWISDSASVAGDPIMLKAQIMDYSATDKHKTVLGRADYSNSNNGSLVEATANRWASTSAVNAISIFTSSGSFSAGSTFSLYGIEA
jgi:hypothetical protein